MTLRRPAADLSHTLQRQAERARPAFCTVGTVTRLSRLALAAPVPPSWAWKAFPWLRDVAGARAVAGARL
jgi:hypothetical protein